MSNIEVDHTEYEPIHPWRWTMLTVWCIVVTIALGWYVHNSRDQVKQIQASRVETCRAVYKGIEDVFQPFLPKKGEKTTPKQRANVVRFHNIIHQKRDDCIKLVTPPPAGKERK